MQQRFLSQILLLAQHVSGTTMPINRSSRILYSGCCLWYFVLWQQPLYNTLELLMMGIVVPETCWASNKTCNKKTLLHLVGILFPHILKYLWILCCLVTFPNLSFFDVNLWITGRSRKFIYSFKSVFVTIYLTALALHYYWT